uniref:Uncharacterized protein n=1 Tax=Hucho hucho TaxID=62062 RepID=A0A4W5LXS8_9TELE
MTGCLYLCPQLDCCGKGDDSPLFKQVAGALCPKKTQDDALLKPQSCHLKLKDLFTEKLCLIGLAALVVAVIMVSSVNMETLPERGWITFLLYYILEYTALQ